MIKKPQMIKLYKYEGSLHYIGNCFPPFDQRCTEWSDDKQQQIDLYNSAKKQHFTSSTEDAETVQEMDEYNKESILIKEIAFFWCMLYEIEVPLRDWEYAKENDNYEEIPYLVDFNYTHIAERGIYLNGRGMSKKVFDSIVYEPYIESNKDGSTGVIKPKNIIYGKIK